MCDFAQIPLREYNHEMGGGHQGGRIIHPQKPGYSFTDSGGKFCGYQKGDPKF